ncbi:Protein C2-DOMAIN ABA-RELATED 4 [Linum grandiflorum]
MRNKNSKLKKAQTTVAQILTFSPASHVERLFRFGLLKKKQPDHRRSKSDPVELEHEQYKTKSERGKRMTDSPAVLSTPSPPPSSSSPAAAALNGTASPMDSLLGLLRIRVKRGVNLAVRDVRSSDPYCVIRMGKQKLKTRFVRKDVNPEWNEDLTLSITNPDMPIKLTVYDHDTFSLDDKMGEAEFDIIPFMEALRTNVKGLPNGTIIKKLQPDRQNCLAEESPITCADGKILQDMCLRLKNVECGEVELQLQWIDLHSSRGS